MVSCGLLAEITVNGKYGPGDLVPSSDEVKVAVRVLGPGWVKADKVELYANGTKVREAKIVGEKQPGVKWAGEWTLPRFRHDVHLVAIATGPGVTELYWPIAKPYQATSLVVERRVIGASGAVWVDGVMVSCGLLAEITVNGKYGPGDLVPSSDEVKVAVQAASLLRARGILALDPAIRAEAAMAGPHVERGFALYAEAWRECQVAKTK